jgi:hypothetical protein
MKVKIDAQLKRRLLIAMHAGEIELRDFPELNIDEAMRKMTEEEVKEELARLKRILCEDC